MPSYENTKDILRSILPEDSFRPQSIADWTGDYPLPNSVSEYFREFGPEDIYIPAYGNNIELPSLSKLWEHQLGYRIHGLTKKRIPEWEEDWLVVGNQGGDPFIFSRSSETILHAFHGEGAWEPDMAFNSLPEMTTAIAVLGRIVKTNRSELTREDGLIRPRFLDLAKNQLVDVGFLDDHAAQIISRFGWH
jgi:hypothetical protein